MNASDSLANLFQALSAFQGEVQGVAKDKSGHHGAYTTLGAARAASAEALAKHGLSVVQLPEGDGLTTIVGHSSGEWVAATMNLHLPKEDPQGQGSAITYARRYAYMAALGLAPEDDDGAAATASVRMVGSTRQQNASGSAPGASGTGSDAATAGPCSICGSTRAQTVLHKGIPRCAIANDCKKRAEERQAAPVADGTEPF